eukprot:763286-Hanusia_phi.AAC.2
MNFGTQHPFNRLFRPSCISIGQSASAREANQPAAIQEVSESASRFDFSLWICECFPPRLAKDRTAAS